MKRLNRLLVLWVALFVLAGLSTQAHGYLLRSIPQDRSTLERSPTRLQYWFSEDLEPRFSSILLRDANGNVLAEGGVDGRNRALMALQLPANALPDGAYIVELRPAFSSDGHVSAQSQVFFVGGSSSEDASFVGASASEQAQPLEIVWKSLWQASMVLLFGATMLYNSVLLPVWGNPRHVAGQLPPRLMNALNGIMGLGLGLAIFAHLFALIQQTMVFFNVSLSQALSPSLWDVVRVGSRFGDVWNGRSLLLVLLGACFFASIFYKHTYPRSVKPFWGAMVWGVALLIGTQATTSHAAGSLVLAWVAVAVHWLHTLATAFWVGGLIVLVWVLPIALQPYEGQARQTALRLVMMRYSRLVFGAVLVVIASGAYSSANWFFSASDVATSYGRALGLKVLLVGLLLLIGAGHHLALRPALVQRLKPFMGAYHRLQGAFSTFGGVLRLEAMFGVVVLVLASVLSATPIPQPEALQRAPIASTFSTEANGYSVSLTVAPFNLGVNTYDVVVRRGDTLINDLTIEAQFVAPERDARGVIQPIEAADEGVYVASGADLNALGTWWALVDLITPDGETTRAFFAFDLTQASSLDGILSPTLFTPTFGVLVILACAFVLAPSALWLYQRLNLSKESLLVAFSVIVISVILSVASFVIVEAQRQNTIALQNPPPDVVNAVLPDQASLERGKALYNAHCIGWQTVTDFQALMNGMASQRDEVLYEAVIEGWRRMPPCNTELSEEARWDIVNYARTLRRQYTRR